MAMVVYMDYGRSVLILTQFLIFFNGAVFTCSAVVVVVVVVVLCQVRTGFWLQKRVGRFHANLSGNEANFGCRVDQSFVFLPAVFSECQFARGGQAILMLCEDIPGHAQQLHIKRPTVRTAWGEARSSFSIGNEETDEEMKRKTTIKKVTKAKTYVKAFAMKASKL